jgi:Domain of unknown function (DUF151)/Integrase core domain
VFAAEGSKVLVTPVQAPQANAYAERWVGTVRREVLDRMLIVGRVHLERVLGEYLWHYNVHRPDRALEQAPPRDQPAVPTAGPVGGWFGTIGWAGFIHEYAQVARRVNIRWDPRRSASRPRSWSPGATPTVLVAGVRRVRDSARDHIVLLAAPDGPRRLPVWIRRDEAHLTDVRLLRAHLTRPLTHDLAVRMVAALGGGLREVCIDWLADRTFYAVVVPIGLIRGFDDR